MTIRFDPPSEPKAKQGHSREGVSAVALVSSCSVIGLLWIVDSGAAIEALGYSPWALALAAAGLVLFPILVMLLLLSRLSKRLKIAQRSLNDSENGFLTLMKASPASIWLYDVHSLALLKANPTAEIDYGYSTEDLQAMSIKDLVCDLPPRPRSDLSDSEAVVPSLEGEHWLRTKSGTRRISRITAAVCSVGNRVVGLLVASDQENGRSNSSSTRTGDRLRLAQEVAGLGYWQYEMASGVGECSEEVRRFFGLAQGQPFDRSLYDALIPEAEREAIKQVHATAARVGHAEHQYQIHPPGGDARCLYERIKLDIDAPSGHRTLFAAVLDMSELRSTDAKRARQRTLYERIINGFPEGVVVVRGDHIQFANEAARKMLLAERPDSKLFAQYIHPDERAREVDRLHALQRGLIPESPLRQVRLVRSDASELETEIIEIRLDDAGESDVQLLIRDVTHTRRMQMDLEDANRRLQALSQRLLEVQETERRQLARDLHDDIGQQLTGLKLHLQRMARHIEHDEALRNLADHLIDTIDTLLATVRRLSLALHPLQLESLGLEPAMRSHLSRFLQDTGIRHSFKLEGTLDDLPSYTRLVAFRIFQEAVNNLVRHAHAKSVQVNLSRLEDGLRLDVIDDGMGFDVAAAHQRAQSLGLTSMQERVASLSGDLKISSLTGVGTRIAVWLPTDAWDQSDEEGE